MVVSIALHLGNIACQQGKSDASTLLDGETSDATVGLDASNDAPDTKTDLGTVAELEETCADGPGEIAGSTCVVVEVACPNIAALRAQIRITPPAGKERGTVVFSTGSTGSGFYETNSQAQALLEDLVASGFRIVQRAWDGENGWTQGPGGFGGLSCRYATLLTWIHANVFESGAFCASGNSAGSGEIAYALARWTRGEILDLAVPTGGPPFARLDWGCHGDEEWEAQCIKFLADTTCSASSCRFSPNARMRIDEIPYAPDAPCQTQNQENAAVLLQDSVLAPNAVLDYPKTTVHFVFGDNDCNIAHPLGLLYAQSITSPVTVDVAANTMHDTFSTPEGAEAIFQAIESGCQVR